MKIGVCYPSRGLIVAASIQHLLKQLKDSGIDYDIRIPFTLGIPECFNNPVATLMKDPEITHVLMVEDDVVIPENGLQKLIDLDADVACIDYPLSTGYSTITRLKNNKIIWCGTGCTLIKRKVLEKIGYPYFRTDIAYLDKDNGFFEKNYLSHPENRYGGHDIHFGIEVTQKYKFEIKQVEGMTASHLKLLEMGVKDSNNGNHEFTVYNRVDKRNVLKDFILLTN